MLGLASGLALKGPFRLSKAEYYNPWTFVPGLLLLAILAAYLSFSTHRLSQEGSVVAELTGKLGSFNGNLPITDGSMSRLVIDVHSMLPMLRLYGGVNVAAVEIPLA